MTSATWSGRTRAGHHHGSHTPTSPEAVVCELKVNFLLFFVFRFLTVSSLTQSNELLRFLLRHFVTFTQFKEYYII